MKLDKSFGKYRKKRCGECDGCKSQNCGLCIYCKDSKKFGGTDKMKQVCKNRTCANLKKRHEETTKNSAPILPNKGLFHSVGGTQVMGSTSTYWDSPAPEVLDISNEHYDIEQGSFAMNQEEIKNKAETPEVPYVDDDIERDSFAKNQEKIKDESEMRRKRIGKPPKALQKYRLKNQMWLRKPKIMSDVEKGQACPAVEKFVSLLYSEDVKIDFQFKHHYDSLSPIAKQTGKIYQSRPSSGLPFHPCLPRKRKEIQNQILAVMECLNDSTHGDPRQGAELYA